jgi:hypothetical protein
VYFGSYCGEAGPYSLVVLPREAKPPGESDVDLLVMKEEGK